VLLPPPEAGNEALVGVQEVPSVARALRGGRMRRNRNWLLERAKAVLAKEALTTEEIMERFGVPKATAWDWARRYRAEKPTDMRRATR
jgi:hypothetical protein